MTKNRTKDDKKLNNFPRYGSIWLPWLKFCWGVWLCLPLLVNIVAQFVWLGPFFDNWKLYLLTVLWFVLLQQRNVSDAQFGADPLVDGNALEGGKRDVMRERQRGKFEINIENNVLAL